MAFGGLVLIVASPAFAASETPDYWLHESESGSGGTISAFAWEDWKSSRSSHLCGDVNWREVTASVQPHPPFSFRFQSITRVYGGFSESALR
jgi:hypothetical protein